MRWLLVVCAIGCGAQRQDPPANRVVGEPAPSTRCRTFAATIAQLGGPDAGGGPTKREQVLLQMCVEGTFSDAAIACGTDDVNDRLMCVCTSVSGAGRVRWDELAKKWYFGPAE